MGKSRQHHVREVTSSKGNHHVIHSITDCGKVIIISLIKSICFAWLIVIIGSYYGMKVTGGAEGVGKATTKSVVASIFAVILADAAFSLIYI